jgi:hypothetical protein
VQDRDNASWRRHRRRWAPYTRLKFVLVHCSLRTKLKHSTDHVCPSMCLSSWFNSRTAGWIWMKSGMDFTLLGPLKSYSLTTYNRQYNMANLWGGIDTSATFSRVHTMMYDNIFSKNTRIWYSNCLYSVCMKPNLTWSAFDPTRIFVRVQYATTECVVLILIYNT